MTSPDANTLAPQEQDPEVIGLEDAEAVDPPRIRLTGRGRLTRLTRPTTDRWSRLPLRARLLSILLILLLVALALTGVGTTLVLKRFLVSQVDQDLSARQANQILGDMQRGSATSSPDDDQGLPSRYVVRIMVAGQSAQTYYRDQQLDQDTDRLPRFPSVTTNQVAAHPGEHYTVDSVDHGTRWRMAAFPVRQLGASMSSDPVGYAFVALPLNQVDEAVHQVELIFLVLGGLLVVACAGLGWLAIRRAFVPLVEVEETAAAIAAGDLSQRVPERPSSTEVGRLTTSLNGMLAQIENAFRSREASEARTRRFAADASHELRTPLASIRGFAELYRQGAVREADDVKRTMGRIEDEARRMGVLVEDLLLLARLDEQRPVRSDPVDLLVLAGDAVHDARGLAPDRTVTLAGLAGAAGPASALVTGDDARLRQVVTNLVGNAVRHTRAGTPVEVAVGTTNGAAVLEVRDHGAGLPAEHAVKVFERFYRVDASRARGQGGGSGLGLSIVAAVATSHGGRVGVAETPGGGATFRLELPSRIAEDPENPL